MSFQAATLTLLVASLTAAAALAVDEAPTPVSSFEQVAGIGWKLTSITLDDKVHATGDEAEITLAITDVGAVSGRSAVNRYFGKFSLDGEGGCSWDGPLGSTRMAGPPHLMAWETRFLNSLAETSSISLVGGDLHLTGKEGKLALVFSQPEE